MTRFDVRDMVLQPERVALYEGFENFLETSRRALPLRAYEATFADPDFSAELSDHPLIHIMFSDEGSHYPAMLFANLELYFESQGLKGARGFRVDDYFSRGPDYNQWRRPAAAAFGITEVPDQDGGSKLADQHLIALASLRALALNGQFVRAEHLLQIGSTEPQYHPDIRPKQKRIIDLMVENHALFTGGNSQQEGPLDMLRDPQYWGANGRKELERMALYLEEKAQDYSRRFSQYKMRPDAKSKRKRLIGSLVMTSESAIDQIYSNPLMKTDKNDLVQDSGAPKPDDGENGPA